ncbi:hypothetical protein [Niabella hibiscisoli]|uniref:hypothetical protein n=1 Tax=Niabella hibiscisoli TaxID=1825928 RepID=UPI001F0EB23D|nr:hypothetical protein [Niabella hibiscisoli]MCH5719779.1 hypothetical protein [Niabella hibiscisoli]
MKGRPNIYQDEELILKAQELFWKKGYNATSLSDLSNVTGAVQEVSTMPSREEKRTFRQSTATEERRVKGI